MGISASGITCVYTSSVTAIWRCPTRSPISRAGIPWPCRSEILRWRRSCGWKCGMPAALQAVRIILFAACVACFIRWSHANSGASAVLSLGRARVEQDLNQRFGNLEPARLATAAAALDHA